MHNIAKRNTIRYSNNRRGNDEVDEKAIRIFKEGKEALNYVKDKQMLQESPNSINAPV